jgi:hypothetical protein
MRSISLTCLHAPIVIKTGTDQQAKWPFVTLNSFQRRASVTQSLSGAIYLSTNHYVKESQRSAWENYTEFDTSNYLVESYEYFSELGILYFEQNRRNPIYMYSEEAFISDNPAEWISDDPGPGPYLVSFFDLFFAWLLDSLTQILRSLVGKSLQCQVHILLE